MLRGLVVLVVLLVAAPAARADTIVFRRGSDVWRMSPDGSGQTKLTPSERRYEWPSAADDGTLVASDETGRLWRMTLDGVALGGPIPTAATFATDDAPAETPTHVRISPDATKIAYDQVIDGDPTTLWTPATATGLDFPGQEDGQAFLVDPSWIGSGALLLSRDVASQDPGATFSRYALGPDDSEEPWFSDGAATWATGFDAAASRDGSRIAVLEDDAADNDGTPTRVVLRLFAGPEPTFRCELGLTATDDVESISPTFSPDGTRLAWAEPDGIHVATLGALTDCAAIREQVVTLPGAWEPYWTPATPAAARPGAPTTTTPAPLTLDVKTRARPHRSTLRKRGLRVRVTVSAPTTVRLSVKVAGTKRFAAVTTRKLDNAGTTTITVRLRSGALRAATRLVLHVSAPGATPVDKGVRPL
ncbi:PD40 domain-containing protein [Solirubrobacter soli]|uniref:PD40 domain-containing protein n=1 Tax=Solirubrobacter soli TaxID=363832 RepID=UPI000429ABEA|nr:PD40 domain-containing protein [Solirubrobacter soli]